MPGSNDNNYTRDGNHESYTTLIKAIVSLVPSPMNAPAVVAADVLLNGSGASNEDLRGFAAQGNVNGIRNALRAGVNVNTRGNSDLIWSFFSARNDCTPLMLAASYGHLNAVKALVEEGRAHLNLASSFGNTALDLAVKSSHHDVARYLHGLGATLKSVDNQQLTQLLAIQTSSSNVLR